MFDVTMGSYTMELKSVNLLAFSSSASSQRYSVKTTWVFQRRRLVCFKEYYWETVRKSEKIVSKIIDNFALKITAQANLQIVHFLDVTFIKQAYRKPNNDQAMVISTYSTITHFRYSSSSHFQSIHASSRYNPAIQPFRPQNLHTTPIDAGISLTTINIQQLTHPNPPPLRKNEREISSCSTYPTVEMSNQISDETF